MKTMVIIQARMGSSRLPGKVLKSLGQTTILDHVVSRCQQIKQVDHVVVATSDLSVDNQVEQWCNRHNVPCFRGSETDVLTRYYDCAQIYQPDCIVRVTADCPFVDYHLAEKLIKQMNQDKVDYIKVAGDLTRGLIVEVFSFRALAYIFEKGHEERHREHVTYFAYEYPELFNYSTYQAPDYLLHPELRITVDTIEDYQMIMQIAEHTQDKLISAETIVDFLLNHPEIAKVNEHIQQKPVK
ncbi:cytidylyltransferase domain-containing protein [Amphibacillus sp. Q70]|uniref:cytidylyltransferase domain-containing protein n=1 Tax=Amphibacillus sp. Q70 TaxID=3453416 RepID=UPI003F82AF04